RKMPGAALRPRSQRLRLGAAFSPAAGREHGGQPFCRAEVFLGELAGGAPMERIIAVDLARAGDRFGEIAESQKPATGGQMLAEAGVFGEHRPAAGEIGGAAVAEPAGVKLPVERLRAAELGARALDVFAILRRRARHPVGRCQTPAGALQKLAVAGLVAGMNVGGKLERAA